MSETKRYMGVDFGAARTGIARSDDLGMYTVGLGNIKSYNVEKAAMEIAAKAEEIKADVIVVGKPVNMDGSCGEKAQNAVKFGEMIAEHTNIKIEYFDERLTTVMAHQILGDSGIKAKDRKNVVDSLSAELILQGYMDTVKNKSNIQR